MTSVPKTPVGAALLRAVLALLVACAWGALAASAAAASTPPGADPAANEAGGGAPVVGSASGPQVASVATAPGPPDASAASNLIVVGAAPSPPTPAPSTPSPGGPVRPGPAVIASGASDGPVGHPSASGPVRGGLETQIISSSPRRLLMPVPRPTVAQLASGGPFVAAPASSGPAPAPALTAAPAARPRPPARSVVGGGAGSSLWSRGLPLFAAPVASARVVSVSVAMEGVFISGSTSARRPGQRSVPVVGRPVGPAGLGSESLGVPWGAGSRAPAGSAWMGSAPLSGSGGTGISLLGLNVVLAAVSLLAGVSWGRRSWRWPELGIESLLCSSALDRPG